MIKAIIFDLDGTAIPNKPDGMPSENLIKVVRQLQNKLKVSAATGRPWFNSKPIIQKLGLKDPCIISGGTQIIDPITAKILWEKDMSRDQVEQIMRAIDSYNYPVFFSDDEENTPSNKKVIKGPERIIYIEPVTKDDTEEILGSLNDIADITSHKVMSWTQDHFDIHITHAEATKNNAMKMLLKLLNVNKSDVVAIGDGNNDLPLFEQAGYKIAMENGSEELKKKADKIAPSVEKDGLTKVLMDFLQ